MSIDICDAMELNHGRITLIAEPNSQTLNLATANQEYLIELTMDPERLATAHKFSYEDGIVTYTGTKPLDNMFIGMAVVEASKGSTVLLNGYLGTTQVMSEPAVFSNSGDRQPFHVASSFTMPVGSTLHIKAKSDTANTQLTFISYTLVYDGYQV